MGIRSARSRWGVLAATGVLVAVGISVMCPKGIEGDWVDKRLYGCMCSSPHHYLRIHDGRVIFYAQHDPDARLIARYTRVSHNTYHLVGLTNFVVRSSARFLRGPNGEMYAHRSLWPFVRKILIDEPSRQWLVDVTSLSMEVIADDGGVRYRMSVTPIRAERLGWWMHQISKGGVLGPGPLTIYLDGATIPKPLLDAMQQEGVNYVVRPREELRTIPMKQMSPHVRMGL